MSDTSLSPRRPFGSVLTAMITPFADDGSLDLDAAGKVATFLVDQGNDGLVVSGTTGESPTTTDAEKVDLLRVVIDAVGDRATVVAGVGSNDTAHTVEAARAAERAGAAGLLVVTPYYSKPPQTGLLAHFTTVADATGLPVLVYDIPGRAGVPIQRDTMLRLGEHPRIVAVKDAKGDLFEVADVMAHSDLAYYSGIDELNLAHLTQGGSGVVSVVGHVASEQLRSLVDAVDACDLATAAAVHRDLIPVTKAVMHITQGAIMSKAGLQLLGVLGNREVRLPLVPATDDEVTALAAVLPK
ncbi:MAG: 4-hydroxy-tetrahydrodipicolinate synthase [Actinomycetales bacterium]